MSEVSEITTSSDMMKLLRIIYRTHSGSIDRSALTRAMLSKKLNDKEQREQLINEARTMKLINVGRRIQFDKGGQNPLVYKITKLGMDIVAPHVGDDDLEYYER